ncbi:MAG: nucleotidyltransferase domain-containing protein [Desulfobacterales bacterium]|nr:MAG: nucleotidyltransferase domain-containing protein [Desulfobacterales bacterium]
MNKDQILKTSSANKELRRRYFIKALYLFGSVARDESRESSAVDILVEFDPQARIGMFQFVRLRRELRSLLGCDVDLATPEALHQDMKEDILKEAIHAG